MDWQSLWVESVMTEADVTINTASNVFPAWSALTFEERSNYVIEWPHKIGPIAMNS